MEGNRTSSTTTFDYSLYIGTSENSKTTEYQFSSTAFPAANYDPNLSTSACSSGSGYDSAYASPSYGQSFTQASAFSVQQPVYGSVYQQQQQHAQRR